MARLAAIAIVVFAVTTSMGCGIKKEVHQKALDDLANTQTKLNETEKDRDSKAERVTELEGELSAVSANLSELSAAEREKRLRIQKLVKDMEATESELLALRKQQEQTKKRLDAFRKLNQRFRALVDTGKLQVDFRNGQMVLKLPSGVLFASGKAELSNEGQTALAEVLEEIGRRPC